ncbi:hypothetical protein ACOME3_002403 [Neoechinorhynchus agilis]
MNVLVQVNSSGEESKSGLDDDDQILTLCSHIVEKCSNLIFKGLMTIASPNEGKVVDEFKYMNSLRLKVSNHINVQVEEIELSMGMSSDYLEAVKEGSTILRIGSSIFGPRNKNE